MNNYQVEHFNEKAPIGAKVFFYPNGRKDVNTVPRIGWVQVSHPRGICDIGVLPSQDGAVERCDHVPHVGDPRVFDHQGNVSSMARSNGIWDFHPDEKERAGLAAQLAQLMELVGDTKEEKKTTAKKG